MLHALSGRFQGFIPQAWTHFQDHILTLLTVRRRLSIDGRHPRAAALHFAILCLGYHAVPTKSGAITI
jgi:hypothetical protein